MLKFPDNVFTDVTRISCLNNFCSDGAQDSDDEESRSHNQSSTRIVQEEQTITQSDGRVVTSQTSQMVAKSARYTSNKSQKTTTAVVKIVQSNKVVVNGDESEVS